MKDTVQDVTSGVKSLGHIINMSVTGNKGVWDRRIRRSRSWRYICRRRVRVMTKLDQSQVERIIREKRKGTHNKITAEQAGVSVRWIQKLWKRYKKKDKIIFPETMGRSKKDTSGCREYSAVLSAISKARHGAFTLERVVKNFIGIHILHNTIHKMLRDADTSENQPKKSERRK